MVEDPNEQPLSPDADQTPAVPPAPQKKSIGRWRKLFNGAIASVLLLFPLTARVEEGASSAPASSEPSPSGALVIAGGKELSDDIHDCFLELAGGENKAHLLMIPTAWPTLDESDLDAKSYWKGKKMPATLRLLHTRNRTQADEQTFAKPLQEATGVWFSGGDQSLLTAAYKGTKVEEELHKLLKRGGVIGGTSAGAAVMSKHMIAGGNPKASIGIGFGFLSDIIVDQHFSNRNRKDRMLYAVDLYPECVGMGIDERTAVVVRELKAKVFGVGGVHMFNPRSATREIHEFKKGDEIDLKKYSPTVGESRREPMNIHGVRSAR